MKELDSERGEILPLGSSPHTLPAVSKIKEQYMWAILVWLVVIILLQVVDSRYKRLQQRASGGFEQVLAIGQRGQPLWKVGGWVSGAAIAGFAGSRALGLDEMYGSVVAALAIFYFERTRYPKLLITTEPHMMRVTFENLRSTTIDINDRSRFLLDGRRLELQEEGSRKRIVLFRHDFPAVDFDALWQWLTDMQRGRAVPVRGRVAAIDGFRTPEGVSELLFLPELSSRLLLLLCWVGLLIVGLESVFQ